MNDLAQIREKLNEYQMMLRPLERAEEELSFARRMLRARVEEEIYALAPALGALAETLRVSGVDLLLAADKVAFLNAAVERSGMTPEELQQRLAQASSTANEDLKLLGFGDNLGD